MAVSRQQGTLSAKRALDLDIPPMCDGEAYIKHPAIDTAKECLINFIYFDKKTDKFVAKNKLCSQDLSKMLKTRG